MMDQETRDKYSQAWRRLLDSDASWDEFDFVRETVQRNWDLDISNNARDFFAVALGVEEIEDESPFDFLIGGIVAATWEAAFKSAAKMLGVDKDDLQLVCSEYYEEDSDDDMPESIGPDGLLEEIEVLHRKMEDAQRYLRAEISG